MKKYVIAFLSVFLMTVSAARASVVVIPISGTIDGGLAAFIDRSISEAARQKADFIIFQIDTPGGRVDSAVHIKDSILKSKIPTIAFVDKNAISAGSLISLACDSLYMSTGASIGAATAVDLEGRKASEKVISYFRAQMRATAEAKGRRADIAEAMVDENLSVEGISEKGQLLTLTYVEALKVGISNGTLESVGDITSRLGYKSPSVIFMKVNWAENVVRFLTHPIVSSLLMSIGFIGLLIELKTPGWGLGGTIALIALALFFGSHYIVRLATVGELLIFAVGIILLTLEIFVIPGFGIAGISGITLIFLSLFLSLVGKIPGPTDYLYATYTIGGSIIIAVLGGIAVIKILPRTSLYHRLTLATVENAREGFSSAASELDLAGAEGTAISDLRPAGVALIGNRRLDVVTDGEYIEKGSPIVISEVHGARVVVRRKQV
ncbi:nodulation protein NfeD [bacterium]|nr:nodulation protein NfeD [bacterium]